MPSNASPILCSISRQPLMSNSRGIVQVSQAISEMDKVTQQNASLVEEASAAAASLEEQAARLTQAVDAFRLQDTGATMRASFL